MPEILLNNRARLWSEEGNQIVHLEIIVMPD